MHSRAFSGFLVAFAFLFLFVGTCGVFGLPHNHYGNLSRRQGLGGFSSPDAMRLDKAGPIDVKWRGPIKPPAPLQPEVNPPAAPAAPESPGEYNDWDSSVTDSDPAYTPEGSPQGSEVDGWPPSEGPPEQPNAPYEDWFPKPNAEPSKLTSIPEGTEPSSPDLNPTIDTPLEPVSPAPLDPVSPAPVDPVSPAPVDPVDPVAPIEPPPAVEIPPIEAPPIAPAVDGVIAPVTDAAVAVPEVVTPVVEGAVGAVVEDAVAAAVPGLAGGLAGEAGAMAGGEAVAAIGGTLGAEAGTELAVVGGEAAAIAGTVAGVEILATVGSVLGGVTAFIGPVLLLAEAIKHWYAMTTWFHTPEENKRTAKEWCALNKKKVWWKRRWGVKCPVPNHKMTKKMDAHLFLFDSSDLTVHALYEELKVFHGATANETEAHSYNVAQTHVGNGTLAGHVDAGQERVATRPNGVIAKIGAIPKSPGSKEMAHGLFVSLDRKGPPPCCVMPPQLPKHATKAQKQEHKRQKAACTKRLKEQHRHFRATKEIHQHLVKDMKKGRIFTDRDKELIAMLLQVDTKK